MCRVALQLGQEHPELTFRRDALLCSINERLGALLHLGAGEPVPVGADLTPLTSVYLDELIHFGAANAEDQEDALEEGRDDDA